MQFYLIPKWFFGFDIALELFFGIITLLVAVYSLYIYKLSAQRECKFFGLSFIAISVSYFLWSAINAFITSVLNDGTRTISINELSFIGFVGVYSHILLHVLGLATLAYMTLNVRGNRGYILFTSLPLLLVVFSTQKAVAFYFVSSFLLMFVAVHYILEHRDKKRLTTLFLLFAFVLIFLGNVNFTFSAIRETPYVIGHLLEALGYVFVLVSFILTIRKR